MQEVFSKIIEKLEERTSFLSDCTKYGNKDAEQQNKSYSTMMMYEVSDLVDDLIEIVKQEAEKYNNGWIPCSERLPEEGRGVILYAENKAFIGSHVVFMANIHNGKWQMWESSREVEINYIPIAWQPLPLLLEPYQPKGE